MTPKKIIPCLDIKDGRVVKGVHFVDLKDAADPVEAARAYSDQGADEIAFLDITATVEGRKTLCELVRRVAEVISIPLVVGGGVAGPDDVRRLLDAGASRVALGTAAVRTPEVVGRIVQEYGSDTVVAAIDAKRTGTTASGYEIYVRGGRTPTGVDAVEWSRKMAQMGVGHILPTSMETDGVRRGYDIPLTRGIADAVDVPVIASGGAGTLEHIYEVLTRGGAAAALAASVFHFGVLTIPDVKEYLEQRGVAVRR